MLKSEQAIYGKELTADAVWKGAFSGYTVEREAKFQYANLYWRLLNQLFSDPDFQSACARARESL